MTGVIYHSPTHDWTIPCRVVEVEGDYKQVYSAFLGFCLWYLPSPMSPPVESFKTSRLCCCNWVVAKSIRNALGLGLCLVFWGELGVEPMRLLHLKEILALPLRVLGMPICMYICMDLYIHIFMYLYAYIYTHLYMYICIYVCIYIHICIYTLWELPHTMLDVIYGP